LTTLISRWTGSELTAIVGIGVNVNSQMMSQTPLAAEATSVRDIVGHPVERESLLAAILNQLEPLLLQDMKSIMAEYKKWDILCGKQVVVKPKGKESNEGQYEATAVDFTESGCLRVQTNTGQTFELSTGDVSIRLS
jgi:biotin-(acetyl-CoA carboxylase) ligase